MHSNQLKFEFLNEPSGAFSAKVTAAIETLASQSGTDALGAVFTRAEVVEFILDLVGYTEDQPLYRQRLLEPSFGYGDFLLPAVGRLLSAWRAFKNTASIVDELGDAILAIELHREAFTATRKSLIKHLMLEGVPNKSANALADRWLLQGDFLLTSIDGQFDFVIGNPPYVRQELIPPPLLSEYRKRYRTMFDRADIYVPFIERSLMMLNAGGSLGFICADRWMKNRYGGPLRKLVAGSYHLKIFVDMMDTPAFHSEVSAYPAITVITREKPKATRIAYRPSIDRATLMSLANNLRAPRLPEPDGQVREVPNVVNGAEPWLLGASDQHAIIRRLERQFPKLEEASCKVGIGVATGSDKAFIGKFDELDVEQDRKLPLVTTRDIMTGEVQWQGLGVINPFSEHGGLVDLNGFPRLRRYLEDRKEMIAGRHCAQKNPTNWYRTIDRIFPGIAKKPKLLIPDIKGEAHVVFERGDLYPHHNLYYIISDTWDLHALQAVLLSDVTRLFIEAYSTRMRGGYLRFQAQYLRRIRIPYWDDVPQILKDKLTEAASIRDSRACNRAAFKLYDFSQEELSIIGNNGK